MAKGRVKREMRVSEGVQSGTMVYDTVTSETRINEKIPREMKLASKSYTRWSGVWRCPTSNSRVKEFDVVRSNSMLWS